MVLTLLEVFILDHHEPPTTETIQHLTHSKNHKWHKQGATKLLKLLKKYST